MILNFGKANGFLDMKRKINHKLILMISVFAGLLGNVHAQRNASAAGDAAPQSARVKKLMETIGCTIDEKGNAAIDQAVVNVREKTISFPAKINVVDAPIEVLISTERGRTHESLLVTELDPFKFQLALILAGYRNGAMSSLAETPQGDKFDVVVISADGREAKADSWLYCTGLKQKKADDGYVFVGSSFANNQCVASSLGNLVNINSGDSDTVMNALMTSENLYYEYVSLKDVVPPSGTMVTVKIVPRQDGKASLAVGNALASKQSYRRMDEEEMKLTRKMFDDVRLSGKSAFYDYDKLVPVLSVRLPADHPEAAAEIWTRKSKVVKEYLELYAMEYSLEPYRRIQKVQSYLDSIREVYCPDEK